MTDNHKPLPVSGYTAQPDAKVALVNEFKADEERLLRKLDELAKGQRLQATENGYTGPGGLIQADVVGLDVDQRWLAIARTDFQRAFMALNRAVFQPTRISLPEDTPPLDRYAGPQLGDE